MRLWGIELAGFLDDVKRGEAALIDSALFSSSVRRQDAAIRGLWYGTGWCDSVSNEMATMLMSTRISDRILKFAARRRKHDRAWLMGVIASIESWRKTKPALFASR